MAPKISLSPISYLFWYFYFTMVPVAVCFRPKTSLSYCAFIFYFTFLNDPLIENLNLVSLRAGWIRCFKCNLKIVNVLRVWLIFNVLLF